MRRKQKNVIDEQMVKLKEKLKEEKEKKEQAKREKDQAGEKDSINITALSRFK